MISRYYEAPFYGPQIHKNAEGYVGETNMQDTKVYIEDILGDYDLVKKLAFATINKYEFKLPPTEQYMHDLYRCEHSPIRSRRFIILIENVPSWVAMHLVRHHVGCTPYVGTQRTDRTDCKISRGQKPQEAPVMLRWDLNCQSIIDISQKRLCFGASPETRYVWKLVLEELRKVDKILVDACVPSCLYRGHCPEITKCGFADTDNFQNDLLDYRKGILKVYEEEAPF